MKSWINIIAVRALFLIFLVFPLKPAQTQAQDLNWTDLSTVELNGRAAGDAVNPFQRFPDSMQNQVRPRVWELSTNPAGVQYYFRSGSPFIKVLYEVEGEQQFPHMPATGVSGVDLYVRDSLSNWKWIRGNFRFADTISYTFQLPDTSMEREFLLYLPLYVTVKSMQVGVEKPHEIEKLNVPKAKPLVVYGTSITQGACASRPGNAWSNIVGRELDVPVLNFGFSGNGRLEENIIAYLAQLPARAYFLDCLANFTGGQGLNAAAAYERILQSVHVIRKNHPMTPIVLVDHAGYPDGDINLARKHLYEELNLSNLKALEQLKSEGVTNLYLLSHEDLGLTSADFVDGVHPTDGGMQKYARAYMEIINKIEDR